MFGRLAMGFAHVRAGTLESTNAAAANQNPKGILPLSAAAAKSIALVGPMGNITDVFLGDYRPAACPGTSRRPPTLHCERARSTVADLTRTAPLRACAAPTIQKGTRVLISLWVPGTRPHISESHSEISTQVPLCITRRPSPVRPRGHRVPAHARRAVPRAHGGRHAARRARLRRRVGGSPVHAVTAHGERERVHGGLSSTTTTSG